MGFLIILISAEFATMMVYIVYIFHVTYFVQFTTSYALGVQRAMAIINLLTDSSLAVTLVILLHHRRMELTNTASIVDRLTQYIIGTSLITVCISFLALACSYAWPVSFSYLALDLLSSKCQSVIALFPS